MPPAREQVGVFVAGTVCALIRTNCSLICTCPLNHVLPVFPSIFFSPRHLAPCAFLFLSITAGLFLPTMAPSPIVCTFAVPAILMTGHRYSVLRPRHPSRYLPVAEPVSRNIKLLSLHELSHSCATTSWPTQAQQHNQHTKAHAAPKTLCFFLISSVPFCISFFRHLLSSCSSSLFHLCFLSFSPPAPRIAAITFRLACVFK